MLKAKEIIIFLPGDGEKEIFKDVEFQSNPEAGLLAIFKDDGKESIMFSGHSYKIEMSEKDAKESYDMAQKAHLMSKDQMKMMLERETGPTDRFSSSFGIMPQIKLVVFDMDGTIIEPRSSWAMIHDYFGTDNSEMLQMYIDHKVSDEEFVKADIKLWNSKSEVPVNEQYINSILDKAKPRDGARELIASLHEVSIKTVILSGGIQYLADKWAKEWDMSGAFANELIDDADGNLTANINASGHNKGPLIEKIVKDFGLTNGEVAAVGDTMVDLPMFEIAGLSIAVNTSDERVISKSKYHLKEGSMKQLTDVIISWKR